MRVHIVACVVWFAESPHPTLVNSGIIWTSSNKSLHLSILKTSYVRGYTAIWALAFSGGVLFVWFASSSLDGTFSRVKRLGASHCSFALRTTPSTLPEPLSIGHIPLITSQKPITMQQQTNLLFLILRKRGEGGGDSNHTRKVATKRSTPLRSLDNNHGSGEEGCGRLEKTPDPHDCRSKGRTEGNQEPGAFAFICGMRRPDWTPPWAGMPAMMQRLESKLSSWGGEGCFDCWLGCWVAGWHATSAFAEQLSHWTPLKERHREDTEKERTQASNVGLWFGFAIPW